MNPVKNDLTLPELKKKPVQFFVYLEIFLLFSIGLFFSLLGIVLLKYFKKVDKKKMKFVWAGAFVSMSFLLFSTLSFNSYEHFVSQNQKILKPKNRSRKLQQIQPLSYSGYLYEQIGGLFGSNKRKKQIETKKKKLI